LLTTGPKNAGRAAAVPPVNAPLTLFPVLRPKAGGLAAAAPVPLARITEELVAIEGWLDELELMLQSYSAASFAPNRLRAKRG
jgi:hypothetical protein